MKDTIENVFKFIPEPHSGKELVQFLKTNFSAVEITEEFEDLALKDSALQVIAPSFAQSLPMDFVQRLKRIRDIPKEEYAIQFVALHLPQLNIDFRIELESACFVASYTGDDEIDEVNRRFFNKLHLWLGISQEDIDNQSDRFMTYVYAYKEVGKHTL